MSFEKNLDKYAKLAIKVGVNIQEGQTLLVRSPIECAPFVRKVVKHAYEAGAKNVHIEWSDEECTLLKYLHAPDETFNEFPRWISDQYVDIAKEGGAFLTVYAQNPDLLKNVDPQRVANFQKASGVALKEWRSYTLSDKCKWSIEKILWQKHPVFGKTIYTIAIDTIKNIDEKLIPHSSIDNAPIISIVNIIYFILFIFIS